MLLAARTTAPEVAERRHERHGKDEIILTVYRSADGGYTHSIQCRLGRLVRSAFPNQTFATPLAAKRAACALLESWLTHNPAARKRAAIFELRSADQPEFDFFL